MPGELVPQPLVVWSLIQPASVFLRLTVRQVEDSKSRHIDRVDRGRFLGCPNSSATGAYILTRILSVALLGIQRSALQMPEGRFRTVAKNRASAVTDWDCIALVELHRDKSLLLYLCIILCAGTGLWRLFALLLLLLLLRLLFRLLLVLLYRQTVERAASHLPDTHPRTLVTAVGLL